MRQTRLTVGEVPRARELNLEPLRLHRRLLMRDQDLTSLHMQQHQPQRRERLQGCLDMCTTANVRDLVQEMATVTEQAEQSLVPVALRLINIKQTASIWFVLTVEPLRLHSGAVTVVAIPSVTLADYTSSCTTFIDP